MHACRSSRPGCVQAGVEGYLASLFTFETKSFGQVSWPLCQVF